MFIQAVVYPWLAPPQLNFDPDWKCLECCCGFFSEMRVGHFPGTLRCPYLILLLSIILNKKLLFGLGN